LRAVIVHARGWSLAQTAQAFLVTPATIASWMKRLDEDGPSAILRYRVGQLLAVLVDGKI
jgi:transcriptional regulator with XRE-family HTH domain